MYLSYGFFSHVRTQSLFDTKIGMMHAPQGDPKSLKKF